MYSAAEARTKKTFAPTPFSGRPATPPEGLAEGEGLHVGHEGDVVARGKPAVGAEPGPLVLGKEAVDAGRHRGPVPDRGVQLAGPGIGRAVLGQAPDSRRQRQGDRGQGRHPGDGCLGTGKVFERHGVPT